MKKYLAGLLMVIFFHQAGAQSSQELAAFFEEAYQQYPTIPRGLLEAVAFSNTRMQHLTAENAEGSCMGLPAYIGVMGLIEDGKGYFENTLDKVATLSGYPKLAIKTDPRINILAYAAAYARLQETKMVRFRGVGDQQPVITDLSEIPQDRSSHNDFARDQQFYQILKHMEKPQRLGVVRSTNQQIDYKQIFGEERLSLLEAQTLRITTNRNLAVPPEDDENTFTCTRGVRQADFPTAVWAAASPRNYSSREGSQVKYITIHTIQGSYASAISWFRNPNARVSTHYVVRASDGQVTQMVCEGDKAFHVRDDNAESIGIEHEGFIDDGAAWYSQEMYESSATLVRDICQRHGINPLQMFGGPPTDGLKELSNTCYRIKGHQHFPGNSHIDPGPYWDWERFYRLVNGTPAPETFTKAQGEIALENYQELTRRTYRIDPEGTDPIELTFDEFDVEGDETTPFDYLDIYDGPDEKGRFLGRFTGKKNPGPLVANSGQVFLEFRADCQVNRKGWSLAYKVIPPNQECPPLQDLVAKNIFPLGATLTWRAIPNVQAYTVRIKRKNLDQQWETFVTRQNFFSITGLGANGLYEWQVQADCGAGQTSAPVGSSFITPSISRKGAPQVYTLRTEAGRFFDSGGEHAGYTDNEAFVYRIMPQSGNRVSLSFTDFDTEEEFDALTVFDGPNTSYPELGTFSGKTVPPVLTSSGGALTLQFTSDGRTQASGWKGTWRSIGGSAPVDEEPGPVDSGPEPVPADDFLPVLAFDDRAPVSNLALRNAYQGDFDLVFDDDSKSGRGLAHRFYNLASRSPGGWTAETSQGFVYANFDGGLGAGWKSVSGTWEARNGRLVQADVTEDNTNIYLPITQTASHTYLYRWRAKMSGNSNNRRSGLHFFCSDPEKPDRGTSYFVWIRDAENGDFVEIYKTINDRFSMKVRRSTEIKTGGVYDFKVIYQPANGRIELYINNLFAASWTDPYPIKSGKAISLRTGNSRVEVDDLIVARDREGRVKVSVGPQRGSDLIFDGGQGQSLPFRVSSWVIDQSSRLQGRWSPLVQTDGTLAPGGAGDDDLTPKPGTTPPGDASKPGEPLPATAPDQVDFLSPFYTRDFFLETTPNLTYYLVTYRQNGHWEANTSLGFLEESFAGSEKPAAYLEQSGTWRMGGDVLVQERENLTNTNLSIPVVQERGQAYLYHWKSRLMTPGYNKRFGLHVFASDAEQTNRGNSYMIWFRNYDDDQDKVEVYRSDNNVLNIPRLEAFVDLTPAVWMDYKVILDTRSGRIQVFVNDRRVLTWSDPQFSFEAGKFVSLRTGSSQVEFEFLRVYKLAQQDQTAISIGRSPGDMVPRSNGNGATGIRVFRTQAKSLELWGPLEWDQAEIR